MDDDNLFNDDGALDYIIYEDAGNHNIVIYENLLAGHGARSTRGSVLLSRFWFSGF